MASQPKTPKESITFRLSPEKKAALDEVAQALGQDRSTVLDQAVSAYLDLYQWQIEEIHRGIAAADAGDMISHEVFMEELKEKRAHLLDQASQNPSGGN